MNLTINNYNGLNLLLAEGTLSDKSLNDIALKLDELPSSADKHIFLDCAGIRKIIFSNAGFSGFINHLLHLRSGNVRITLFGYDPLVHRLIKLLKMERLFGFSPTLDDAYLNLSKDFKNAQATGTVI